MWCIGTGASANDISAIKLMFLCSTVLHVSGVLGLSGTSSSAVATEKVGHPHITDPQLLHRIPLRFELECAHILKQQLF
jgi:hypothetical protein